MPKKFRTRSARTISLRRAALISAALVIGLAVAAPVSAASPTIRFGVDIGSVGSCLILWSTPGETAKLVWRDANGALKAQATNESTDGLWFYCPNNLAVAVGDRLKLTDETSTRTFIVPDLSVRLDRVNDTFKGTGPAGRTVRVNYPQGLFADVAVTHSARVGQDGKWSFHPTNFDIMGGLWATVTWRSPNDDRVTASGVAPNITVTLDKPRFFGYARPNSDVEVTLDDGGPIALGSAASDLDGRYEGRFREGDGDLRPVAAGDHLYAVGLASDADWIVPEIDGAANAGTDVVSGRCHDAGTSANFAIIDVFRTGDKRGYVFASLEANGSFEIDFQEVGHFYADPVNIRHGDKIVVRCLQVTGDWVQLQFLAP